MSTSDTPMSTSEVFSLSNGLKASALEIRASGASTLPGHMPLSSRRDLPRS